jgi:hypothetical protein
LKNQDKSGGRTTFNCSKKKVARLRAENRALMNSRAAGAVAAKAAY